MNLFVLDIDDTLTRSEDAHQSAFINAMRECGVHEIDQNWRSYKHYTDSDILKVNYQNNHTTDFEMDFIDHFESLMTQFMHAYQNVSEVEGASEAINYISNKKDYAIAFATGSLLKPAYLKLDQTEINYQENLVVGSNYIYEREGIVSEAIDRAKAAYRVNSFDNIISVGDGIWDLRTARNLDIHFLGVGMENYREFKNENIKAHIEDWTGFDLGQVEERLGIENG